QVGREGAHRGRIADVDLVELGPCWHPLALARREVVDDRDPVAAGEQGVCDVGADEPGAAGDDRGDGHGGGAYPAGCGGSAPTSALCAITTAGLTWSIAR